MNYQKYQAIVSMSHGKWAIKGGVGQGKTLCTLTMAACMAHLSPASWGRSPVRRQVVWFTDDPDQAFQIIRSIMGVVGAASEVQWQQWLKVMRPQRMDAKTLAQRFEQLSKAHTYTSPNHEAVFPLIVLDHVSGLVDEWGGQGGGATTLSALSDTNGRAPLWVVHQSTDRERMSLCSDPTGEGWQYALINITTDGFTQQRLGEMRILKDDRKMDGQFAQFFAVTQTNHRAVDDFDGKAVTFTSVHAAPMRPVGCAGSRYTGVNHG